MLGGTRKPCPRGETPDAVDDPILDRRLHLWVEWQSQNPLPYRLDNRQPGGAVGRIYWIEMIGTKVNRRLDIATLEKITQCITLVELDDHAIARTLAIGPDGQRLDSI